MRNQILEPALAHHHAGRLDEAAAGYRQILESSPQDTDALHLLGLVMAQSGQPAEGAKLIQQAIRLRPNIAVFHANMGYALRLMGRLDIAVKAYRQAVTLDPVGIKAWLDLAQTLDTVGDKKGALDAYHRVIALQPDSPRAYNDLGGIFMEGRKYDEALECFQRAVESDPQLPEGHHNQAMALANCGRIDEAVQTETRSIALAPNETMPASALIFLMQFHPGYNRNDIYREMRKYNERFGLPLVNAIRPHANMRDPNRKLRIGYVSPDFYLQAECYFVLPLLQSHDHENFEIHCYSIVHRPDDMTQRLKACADFWHDVATETEERLAERIRTDQIDILVDLTMHMRNFCLPLFARKPAPVQVTWLAYPGGTGLTAIDYRLTDVHLDPPDCDQYYSEQSIRLPGSWCCYDPLEDVEIEPASPKGFIRFGSLNNPMKLNEATLRLWARVLQATPDSHLILLVISENHRNRIHKFFSESGVDDQRIEFTGRMDRTEYLKLYNQIDVCLDPLPYNGITTTLDALWMGVPVVSLIGQTAPGRAGLSILTAAGLPEFVARSPEEFIEIASRGRTISPEEIRRKFRNSLMMNARQFAANIEHAYRQMWHRYISQSPK